METYVEEFLFVGRPAGSEQPIGYQVVLGRKDTDAFGEPRLSKTKALNAAEATAKGFDLATILGDVAAQLLGELETLQAKYQDLNATSEAHAEQADAWQRQAEALKERVTQLDAYAAGLIAKGEGVLDSNRALSAYADAWAENAEITQARLDALLAREEERRMEGRYT